MAPRSTYPRLLPGTGGILLLVACLTIALTRVPAITASGRGAASDPPVRPSANWRTLGGYLEDLDDGRVSLAPPVEWRIKSRDKAYVAQFVFDGSRVRFPASPLMSETRVSGRPVT